MKRTDEQLLSLLRATRALLDAAGAARASRPLVVTVDKLEGVIRNWVTIRPSNDQRVAMDECVRALYLNAMELGGRTSMQLPVPVKGARHVLRRVSRSIRAAALQDRKAS
jgi:hypothetical protein